MESHPDVHVLETVPTAGGEARRMQPDQDEPVFGRWAAWLMGDQAGSGCSAVLFTSEGPEAPEKNDEKGSEDAENFKSASHIFSPLTQTLRSPLNNGAIL